MSKSNTSFNAVIAALIETAQKAWNNADIEKFRALMENDIMITMEAVTVGGINFPEQNITGIDEALHFMKKYRKKLPLRYQVEYNQKDLAKHMIYRKFFYEIKVWAHFDCTVSEYGRFKEFHISRYENVHSKKITGPYIIKNLLQHKIKNLICKQEFVHNLGQY